MHTPALRLPKMMIGFIVRRCTVDLGRAPTAAEFATWANSGGGRQVHLFGRPISDAEAHLILRHQARLVSARSASAEEQFVDDALAMPGGNVVRLDEMRARRAARQR